MSSPASISSANTPKFQTRNVSTPARKVPQTPSVAKSQSAKPLQFGAGQKSTWRSVGAWTLGTLTAGIATVAVPLGLIQLAIGCIPALHFLWGTGALTLGVPMLGAVGTYMINNGGKK